MRYQARNARLIELVLLFAALSYGAVVTRKWVRAERRAAWLEGQWSVYESMAEPSPKTFKKW